MRFVALKSAARLDQQTPHRMRSRLVNGRARLIDQPRAVPPERGITVAKGRRALGLALAAPVDDEGPGPSARMRALLGETRREWAGLDAHPRRPEPNAAGAGASGRGSAGGDGDGLKVEPRPGTLAKMWRMPTPRSL